MSCLAILTYLMYLYHGTRTRRRRRIRRGGHGPQTSPQAYATISSGDPGEEDACENSRADDRMWDAHFTYTGHKCDSLVGCLRRSALRLDVPEQAQRATRVAHAHALFLANVMVGGMKTEFDGDGLRSTG